MNLRPLTSPGAVVAAPPAALGRELKGMTIENGGGRFGMTVLGAPKDGPQAMNDGLVASGGDPESRLLPAG